MSEPVPGDDSHGARPAGPSQPLHLRILTIIFGLMFLATLAMVGHLMWTAEPPARGQLERFFAAIGSGRSDEVLSLCDPALQERIDQPVLETWLAAVRQSLGALKTVTEEEPKEPRQPRPPAEASPEGRLVCGTARFEHGSVYAELYYANGRLTDLVVRCDELPPKWCSAWR